jgi:parallel beta-helix repeat protein
MKKIVSLLIIITFSLSGFIGFVSINPYNVQAYTPHDPIYITNDTYFSEVATRESWPGEGTQEDPYIIEGYEFDCSKQKGIYIGFIYLHFIIRDCSLIGYETGIELRSVNNATISDCFFQDNQRGISIINCNDINLKRNVIIDIQYDGIFFQRSNNNSVIGNSITESKAGIRLGKSNKTVVENNSLSLNDYGISIGGSSDNIILNNDIFDNSQKGISLTYSTNNSIISNVLTLNGWFGISSYHSHGNNISYNMISSSSTDGLCLSRSSYNIVQGNHISDCDTGICFKDTTDNKFEKNVLKNNKIQVLDRDNCIWTHIYDIFSFFFRGAIILIILLSARYYRKRKQKKKQDNESIEEEESEVTEPPHS